MYLYLVAIAWMYVVVMMCIAEAASPGGSLLGAFITLVLYGLLPLSILLYILATPARKRRLRRAREQHLHSRPTEPPSPAENAPGDADSSAAIVAPDAGSQPTAAAQTGSVSAVREKP